MFIKYPIRFLLIVIFSKLHKFIYNLTGGKLMGTLMGLPMIFLTTTGRVSNKPRTTPLTYLKDNDDFICVASFGGYKKHPDWYTEEEVKYAKQFRWRITQEENQQKEET